MDFLQPGIVKLPPNLVLDGNNVANEWKFWKQSFEDFLITTGQDESSDKVKLSLLRNMMGQEAARIVATLPLSDKDSLDYIKVVQAIEKYANPRTNVVFDRFLFNGRQQQEGEGFDHFLTDCRRLLKSCSFADVSLDTIDNQLLRDKIVHGIRDKMVQEALLRQDDLTLERSIKFCQAGEQSKRQVEKMGTNLQDVLAVCPEKTKSCNYKRAARELKSNSIKSSTFLCQRCQTRHEYRKCPAFGKVCKQCGNKNHFAVGCRVKNVKTINPESVSDDDGDAGTEPNLNCWTVSENYKKFKGIPDTKQSWSENILIEDIFIKCKLDTGADVSVMPYKIFKQISNSVNVKPFNTHIRLQGFDGSTSTPVGRVSLKCEYKNKVTYEDFMIVNGRNMILGLPGCLSLNLVSRVCSVDASAGNSKDVDKFIECNKDVFEGYGRFPNPCSITLRNDDAQIFHPPTRVPHSLLAPLQEELERLQNRNAIVKVNKISPKACINKIVLVEKPNGKIRLCLDPRDLNEIIVRKPKIMPTLEDIALKLNGKSYFSVFDLSEGFHHMALTDDSSWKCCFATPFGVFRYTVLPFGVSNAPEEFQDAVEKYFGDIENVLVWIDDILVAGRTKSEHDELVRKVLERARKIGAVFNKDKLQYCQREVRYVGQIFDCKGMRVDTKRVESLVNLDSPSNREELQRIIGSFNYVRKYVPRMAELMSPLCTLLKKDSQWIWTSIHQNCFEEMKKVISQAPALTPFDPKKGIVLQCDASKNGIGSCLFQEHDGKMKLVACVSRQMNSSEVNYSQSEKEMLAICFGCNKFHRFIYGSFSVDVHTDHKPLTTIMNKHISKIGSVRLQRMRLKLLRYSLNLKYVSGKKLHFPDMLSRHFLRQTEVDPEMLEMIHTVSQHLPLSSDQRKRLRLATATDPHLSQVKEFCRNGWPKDKVVLAGLFPYVQIKEDIYCEAGILFYGSKIIVPKSLREAISNSLHNGHPGMTKIVQKAKQLYFWPKMNLDLQNVVKTCRTCEKYSRNDPNEPLLPHKVPYLRFEKVGCDILECGHKSFLVIVDYFSHWIELRPLRSKTSSSVIDQMKEVFSRFGYPQFIVADNNPFSSYECRMFYQAKGITIATSTPHYPKSNGMAEKAVGICKNILKKSVEDRSDYREYLMHHNNTPVLGLHCSPSQILNSRIMRTELPVSTYNLQPTVQNNVRALLKVRQGITKEQYNRHRLKKESTYKNGDEVVFRTSNDSYWQKGKVVRKGEEPRSYWVLRNEDNKLLRRNTYQMKKSYTTRTNNHVSLPEKLFLHELSSPSLNLQFQHTKLENSKESGISSIGNNNNSKSKSPSSSPAVRTSRYGRRIVPPQRLNL